MTKKILAALLVLAVMSVALPAVLAGYGFTDDEYERYYQGGDYPGIARSHYYPAAPAPQFWGPGTYPLKAYNPVFTRGASAGQVAQGVAALYG